MAGSALRDGTPNAPLHPTPRAVPRAGPPRHGYPDSQAEAATRSTPSGVVVAPAIPRGVDCAAARAGSEPRVHGARAGALAGRAPRPRCARAGPRGSAYPGGVPLRLATRGPTPDDVGRRRTTPKRPWPSRGIPNREGRGRRRGKSDGSGGWGIVLSEEADRRGGPARPPRPPRWLFRERRAGGNNRVVRLGVSLGRRRRGFTAAAAVGPNWRGCQDRAAIGRRRRRSAAGARRPPASTRPRCRPP